MPATLASNVLAAVIFAGLGILVFVIAFVVIDRLTPYTLWREVIEEHNTALAILLGAVSLDLFAVLLGGATALLPIFARDILHTGPWGVGLLRGAPAFLQTPPDAFLAALAEVASDADVRVLRPGESVDLEVA